MSKSDDLRAWVGSVLAERGWNASQWARRAGVSDSTLSRTKNRVFTMSNRTLERLEGACGIPFAVPLSMQERVLVALFRSISPASQALIIRQLRAVAPTLSAQGSIDVIGTSDNRIAYSGPERRHGDSPTLHDRREPSRYSVVRRR